jgi:O-antigen ligase
MRRLPQPAAWVHLGMALVLLAMTVIGAHVAGRPFFVAAGIGFLVLVGTAAQRWPLATLVAGALATLADPVIVPRVLPDGLVTGPIGLSEPVLAVAGGVIAVKAIRTGRLRTALQDPVVPLVALFIGLAVVSAIVNLTPPLVAVLGIVMTIDAIAIYLSVRAVRVDERAAAIAIGAIVAGTVVVALFGIGQVVIHPELLGFAAFQGYFGEGGRITSFLGNPNPAAAILSIGIPFALFGGLSLPTIRGRWAARVVLLVLLLALLLTFSRSAWMAVALGLVIGAAIIDWRALILLILVVALAWGSVIVMPRGLAVPPEPDGQPRQGPDVSRPPDLVDVTVDRIGNLRQRGDTRARFTQEGIPIILDHLLLGVGPGRYGGAAATIIPSPVYEEYGTSLYGYRTIHNFWQHLLGESGALGTAVFLAILAGLLIRFARAARAAIGTRRVLLAGAATLILVTGFHSFTEMIYEGNLPALLIWLVLGLASLFAPVRPLFGTAAKRRSLPESGNVGS